MKFEDLKKELLKNDKFKKAYFEKDEANLAIEIGSNILDARISAGLTQKELAKKVNTQQPSIARAENGSQLQSNSFLLKISKALSVNFTDLIPRDFSNDLEGEISFCSSTIDEHVISPYVIQSSNSIKSRDLIFAI